MKQERKRLQFEYINRKPIQLPLKRREILVYLDHISLQSLWSSQSSSQKVDRLWPFLQPGKIKLNRQKIGNAKNWQQLLFESTRNTKKILLQGKNKKRLGEIQLLGTEFAVLTWLIMMFPIHLSSLQSLTNTSSSFYDRQQIFKKHHKSNSCGWIGALVVKNCIQQIYQFLSTDANQPSHPNISKYILHSVLNTFS